jgi:hypothetical protein
MPVAVSLTIFEKEIEGIQRAKIDIVMDKFPNLFTYRQTRTWTRIYAYL